MKNPKRAVLALIMLTGFADGVAHQLTAPGETYGWSDIVFTLLATLLVFAWYRFDSDEMSYRRTPLLNVSIVALTFLALPYCFFKSRGFVRGSVAVGLFIVCCVAYVILQST